MAKTNTKLNIAWRYGFAIALILIGLLLAYNKVGQEFLGFSSVGSWMIYIGFVMLAVITLQMMSKRKRVVDERMEFVAAKAARVTFIGIILAAFAIMIIDGIRPITVSYAYMMSYFICGIVLLYMVAYKVLLRRS